jgi:hypothetical protein
MHVSIKHIYMYVYFLNLGPKLVQPQPQPQAKAKTKEFEREKKNLEGSWLGGWQPHCKPQKRCCNPDRDVRKPVSQLEPIVPPGHTPVGWTRLVKDSKKKKVESPFVVFFVSFGDEVAPVLPYLRA